MKMKNLNKTFLISIILSISTMVSSQSGTLCFDKMNVAYIGLENPLTITLPKDKNSSDSLEIICPNGKFKYIDTQINGENKTFHYIGIFKNPGYFQIKVKNKGNVLFVQDIRCKPIPDPEFKLGLSQRSGSISKKMFLSQVGVGALIDNFDFYYIYSLISYKCSIIENGQILKVFECNQIKFSDEMKEYFKKLKSDDIVLFEDIKVKGNNGDIKSIAAVLYRIN